MAMVKCEYCGFEQDIEKSRICDQCGRRISRAPDNLKASPPPAATKKKEEESRHCPNCGVPTTKEICSNCGAPVRERAL